MAETLSFRLVKNLIGRKFSMVKCVSTQTVHHWKFAGRGQDTTESQSSPEINEHGADIGKLVILDARAPEEYAVSHIIDAIRVHPGAKLSDVENTMSLLKKEQGKQSVVCYCSVGFRGSTYAKALSHQLEKEGTELRNAIQVFNMEGGLFKWANEGKPMVDHKNRPTTKAHPHFEFVGKLLLSRNIMALNPEQ